MDTVADLLTRIRNAIAVNKMQVEVPYSKMKHAIAEVLKDQGYLSDVKVTGDSPVTKAINMNLDGADKIINELHKVSKPGRRVYVSVNDIPSVLGGRGVAILSTSKGIMDGRTARKQSIGGELICKVF
ncbi:MAG: 30S ribosomal protein S8 [Candidatus Saccharimonadales bacterium]